MQVNRGGTDSRGVVTGEPNDVRVMQGMITGLDVANLSCQTVTSRFRPIEPPPRPENAIGTQNVPLPESFSTPVLPPRGGYNRSMKRDSCNGRSELADFLLIPPAATVISLGMVLP